MQSPMEMCVNTFRSKCRSMTAGTNEFPACVKFDGSGLGYSVIEYPRSDSFIHPQTSFTRDMTNHPGYKRLALMSNIQRKNAMFHNGCFNSSNQTLGRVGEDVAILSPNH